MPQGANNSIIPREIVSQLLTKVAPEIHRRMGHSIAFIDQTKISSAPPDASGRNSDESGNYSSSHKAALIALGVVLGVVCLVAIIVIAWYRRKKKR